MVRYYVIYYLHGLLLVTGTIHFALTHGISDLRAPRDESYRPTALSCIIGFYLTTSSRHPLPVTTSGAMSMGVIDLLESRFHCTHDGHVASEMSFSLFCGSTRTPFRSALPIWLSVTESPGEPAKG